ncbi:MAG TPA: M23 family metallopeptidase [Pseudolabrys sp.]|nr:M23 family metallopeptidase [Pseudolabrys sp.]
MSYPATSQPHHGHAAGHGHARARSAAAVSRHVRHAYAGYTLAHAGRQVRIGPVAFWIVVGTLVIMGVWSIATGTYFAFRENVLTRLIGRQTEMQFAYEDRIAELRATVDRITSHQLLNQEQFERKLDQLLRRQRLLESRTSAIANDLLTTGSARAPHSAAPAADNPKPSPINDTIILKPPRDRDARLESREPRKAVTRVANVQSAGGVDSVLSRISASLDKVEERQKLVLSSLEEHYANKAHRIRGVLSDLGISMGRVRIPSGVGGPFVPVRPPGANASAFDRELYRVNVARADADRFSLALVNVPVRKPVHGELDMTSPFGMRMDPFVHQLAMHTGIDFRGALGDPARATAAGTVTVAGWQGGYGNMVEIDHGNGFSTRYGHLSEIDVNVGQKVRAGQVVGKIGSTGRSTGPHLHYETRVNDNAVDPQKFLRAGVRLGAAL